MIDSIPEAVNPKARAILAASLACIRLPHMWLPMPDLPISPESSHKRARLFCVDSSSERHCLKSKLPLPMVDKGQDLFDLGGPCLEAGRTQHCLAQHGEVMMFTQIVGQFADLVGNLFEHPRPGRSEDVYLVTEVLNALA